MSERKLEPKDVPGTFLNIVSICIGGFMTYKACDQCILIPRPF